MQKINHISATVHGWATVTFADGTTKKMRGLELDNAKMNMNNKTEGLIVEGQDVVVEVVTGRKIVDRRVDLSHYERVKVEGRRVLDCADSVAKCLRTMNLNQVYAHAAQQLNVPEDELRQKYNHLNAGMQRMCLGNRIRSAS